MTCLLFFLIVLIVYTKCEAIVGIFSMWYLVLVTYFDRSHDFSQLGSGHADSGQLLPGT